jgi:heptosyltransferase-2
MKVLIIQTAFLGDSVISLSLAEELRRLDPDAFIAYLVRPEVVPIMALSPSVNKIFTYDKYHSESGHTGIRKKATELNEEGFDVVFTLHSSKRTRMLLLRLNARQKIGYGEYDELTTKVKEMNEPHSSKAIRLLKAIYPTANLETLPKLNALDSFLPEEVRKLPRPIIILSPDSVWQTKQWGINRFRALINLLISQNYSIIVTGINEEDGSFNDYNLLKNNVLNLIHKTSLNELTSTISYSDLLISNDSAPVHIATATGTRSIAIYGPTVPEFGFAPPLDLGQVIQNDSLWCRPCTSHGSNECPIHTHECMTSISPEQVFNSAHHFLHRIQAGA